MSTYAELKDAAATLPRRILDATYAGDETALTQLEAERATMPARLFAAELAQLRADLAEMQAELVATKPEADAARQAVKEAEQGMQLARIAHEKALRDSGHIVNHRDGLKAEILAKQARIAELAAQQAQFASAASAPVMRARNVNHIPGPARWPA